MSMAKLKSIQAQTYYNKIVSLMEKIFKTCTSWTKNSTNQSIILNEAKKPVHSFE